MMISPGVLFCFFKILIFWVIREGGGGGGGKRAKNGPKLEKSLSVALPFSGTIHHMVFIYGTHV